MSGVDRRWEREGLDWPNRPSSRFVVSGGIRWHVQQAGHGPSLLLVHGTAASTHSWRDLAPLLARRFSVTAPDLPGHAFTSRPDAQRLSLPGMAHSLAILLASLGIAPQVCVGHSAGAAILARMALNGRINPKLIVSLAGALLPLRSVPSYVFTPLAKLMTASSLVPRLLAWRMRDEAAFHGLMSRTGSRLDARGTELYRRLARDPQHVAAAIGMMSHWDVRPLERELAGLKPPLVLVSGATDHMVPPFEADRVQALVPGARHITLPGIGHLAHEEQPGAVATLIVELAREAGVLSG